MTGGNVGDKDVMYSVYTFKTVPNHVHFIALCLFRQIFSDTFSPSAYQSALTWISLWLY